MNTQNDIVKEFSREMFVEFLKQGIRATYPNYIADVYCKQIDDAKCFASLLEKLARD